MPINAADSSHPLLILIPVFNDWEALQELLNRLDAMAGTHRTHARVLVVDDGSTQPMRLNDRYPNLRGVDVLELRRNLGPQRAIAIGLTYVHERVPCRAIVIMDGDGEDDPADVPRLVERFDGRGENTVVFAERTRRSESLSFRFFYRLFRIVHVLITGHRVRVGNFSIIDRGALRRLVVTSELWNHFAAAVYNARIPFDTIPTARGRRYSGRSRMNFVSLVVHGLSAIAVFSETVGVRLLIVLGACMALLFTGAVVAGVLRLATHAAIPAWATGATGLLVTILLQMAMIAAIFVFLILSSRQGLTFIPLRDYHYFCGELQHIAPPPPGGGTGDREALQSPP